MEKSILKKKWKWLKLWPPVFAGFVVPLHPAHACWSGIGELRDQSVVFGMRSPHVYGLKGGEPREVDFKISDKHWQLYMRYTPKTWKFSPLDSVWKPIISYVFRFPPKLWYFVNFSRYIQILPQKPKIDSESSLIDDLVGVQATDEHAMSWPPYQGSGQCWWWEFPHHHDRNTGDLPYSPASYHPNPHRNSPSHTRKWEHHSPLAFVRPSHPWCVVSRIGSHSVHTNSTISIP